MNNFNYEIFKQEINNGDLGGLEYLEKTIIEEMKNKIKEDNKHLYTDYSIEEYITSLFEATMYLNNCNNICEVSEVLKKS